MAITVQIKHLSFETQLIVTLGEEQGHLSNWEKIIRVIFTANLMGIAITVFEIIAYLFSWVRSLWPWMKVQVNIIKTWCILMPQAFTVPTFDDDDFNSFRRITCEGHTHARTHTHTRSRFYVTFFKVNVENKQENLSIVKTRMYRHVSLIFNSWLFYDIRVTGLMGTFNVCI